MSDVALRVEAIGKKYTIAHQRQGGSTYKTLQDDLRAIARWPLARLRREKATTASREEFWALRDVSFEVKHGEVLGIIGRNGAGKSTLLKILARITEPTTGHADVYGRVGSLLEVGTGFHPELTGRENIYLNGAILGMTRREIRRRFDEIVTFAEIEQFLDTPVKRYSSGMYMRLAFAVAAHLEPEVLIVDEVLAVGDAAFQKKCLGKMQDVAREGRTVLFVSHSMVAVQGLCSSGIVLDKGEIVRSGTIHQAIAAYSERSDDLIHVTRLRDRKDRQGNQTLRFTEVEILDEQGTSVSHVLSGQDIRLRFHYESATPRGSTQVYIAFNVHNSQGHLLTNLNSKDVGLRAMPIGKEGYFECAWEHFNLRSGVYTCTLYCDINGTVADWMQEAFQIAVGDGDYYGTGSLIDRSQGDVLVDYAWTPHVSACR